jgi:hypothetical protein
MWLLTVLDGLAEARRISWRAAEIVENQSHGSRGQIACTAKGGAGMRKRTRIGFGLIVGSAVAALFVVPVKIPFSVSGYGTIAPASKWVLQKGADGQLIASTYDYVTGLSGGFSVVEFERGETIHFTLSPAVVADGSVSAGDTIGTIRSTEAAERLIVLTGELATARATLAAASVGEKAPLVREAEQRLMHARAEAEEHARQFVRLETLFEKGIVSQQEYEIAKGEAALLDIEVTIAESQLQAVSTGDKREQIELIQSRVQALQQEIDVLRERLHSFTITSPFTGILSRVGASDTILVISDTTAYVALIPVRWSAYPYMARARDVAIDPQGLSGSAEGKLAAVGRESQFVGGKPVVVAAALVTASSADLVPGMVVRWTVSCEPVPIHAYVGRLLRTVME